MLTMMPHDKWNPFQFRISKMENVDGHEPKRSSTWVIAPYFMIYFVTYIINFLVWPLLVMERLCSEEHGMDEEVTFTAHASLNFTSTSCIDRFLTGANFSNLTNRASMNRINNETLKLMIIGSVASASLSLVSYFLVWKPTITHCRGIATFLPPMCIICQCILFSYSLTVKSTQVFKYVILAGVMLPSIHCNFQGLFLLFYRMTDNPDRYNFKQKREIVNTRVDLTHALIFVAIIFAGFAIGVCFDTSYALIFVIQFTLSFVNSLYALILAPISLGCCLNKDGVQKEDGTGEDSDASSSEEEIQLLARNARKSKDAGLLSNQGNLFSEAPMIFSETSYRKELIVIIELTIFTIAVISDANLSGPFLLQPPFKLTLREYGYCIAAQGVSKTIGLLLMKIMIYFSPLKHSTLISIAALNYIIYYIVLAVIPSKDYVYITLLINFFGGIAIPTLISFMKINFIDTIETVLEMSIIGSLIATVGFSSMEYFVYMKTRNVFPGTVFLMTAAAIVLGFVIVLGTYFSTTIKNKRRSKHYADKLLNDYQ